MAIYRGPGGSGDATTDATNQATVASNAAAAAQTSQTAAASSASSAASDATNAANSATAASTSASNAATSASTATTQASNASTSATSASTSATTATTQASNASTSATNAASSASAASTSASNASTSASNASTSETNAAASATSAAASYDSFDDRYLGPKSSDPTLDNDGNALLTGALYFNTVSNKLKTYTGSAWVFQANAGANSDITSLSGLTTALSIPQGGTGQTTAVSALNALLPSQTSNSGKVLSTDGSSASWIATSGTGTVTSVSMSGGTTGITTTGGPITTSGTFTLGGTLAVANGGTGVTSSTGSGNTVLSTSPTLVTPILGTPSSGTLTNTTGLPLSTGVTGTLPIANGGTNATTAAGARTSLLPSYTGNGGKVLAVNVLATDVEYITVAGTGTVTSVAATVPTGLSISGSPIVTTGTLAITYASGYSIPTTASQTNWDTAYTDRNKWDGGSTGLTAATGRTSLGATTLGSNLFTITNPSAITFPRYNADNTVSALDAATFRTAIGAGTSSTTGTVTSVGGTGSVNGITLTGTVTSSGSLTLGGTLGSIANSQLTNSSVTVNGTAIALGASGTVTATATNALTIGTGLSGTSYNGSAAVTIANSAPMTYPSGSGIAVVSSGTSWGTTLTAPSGTIVGTTDTQTLTNKRITSRVGSTTSSATPTINTDNVDMYGLTAQAADITSFTTNLSGTPTDGQKLWIYIVGTAARAITWGTSFEASTVTLPTTTVTTNRLDIGFIWNAATSKWRCVASA